MCDAKAVWVGSRTGAAYDSTGITEVDGSDDATDEESISVVPVIEQLWKD